MVGILDRYVADSDDLNLIFGRDQVFRRAEELGLLHPSLTDEDVVAELLVCRWLGCH